MANYRYLGYGITNDKGIAKLEFDENGDPITHSYTGTGAGELDIIASLDDNTHISDSSIQSGTFVVEDCMFYDSGLQSTENTDWIISSGSLSKSFDDNGKTISPSQPTNLMIYANKPSTTSTSAYDWNAPFVVEFDVNAQSGTPQFQAYSSDSGGAYNLNLGATGHYKITYDGTTIYGYRDDVEINHFDRNLPNTRIGFVVATGRSLTYKNFKIYSI